MKINPGLSCVGGFLFTLTKTIAGSLVKTLTAFLYLMARQPGGLKRLF